MSRELMNVRKTERVVQKMWEKVNDAKAKFEARWMMLSLHRVDPELYKNLMDQIDIFDQETITGTAEDIEEHGEATLRGFEAATKVMEKSALDDDAYMLGQCSMTGLKIAIGSAKGSTKRVREVYGQDVVFFSPDELATMIAFRGDVERKGIVFIEAVKKHWPGSELIKRYQEEGT
jgi:hypothetical protein